MFDGEYKNGKRNGEGKEYNNNGILIFEGKYLNNERVSGIQYDTNGNKINEFQNINGEGKKYDYDGNIIYEGEFLNGEKNGKGKVYMKVNF